MICVCALGSGLLAHWYYQKPDRLWIDAHIYYRATHEWLSGGNPWTASWQGVPFAAPPPALLLNLPLQLLGEEAAVAFWVVANSVAAVMLFRRFKLPVWFVLFMPISEGFLGATPDITLAALVLLGGGWIAALAKPYSIPAMIAARRWWALAGAFVVALATMPLLPWSQFIASRDAISAAFLDHTVVVSAWGVPLLMVATSVALFSLGWRRGLGLTTPGLLAQQPHYLLFSLEHIRSSRLLIVTLTLPIPHLAALGIIGYALWERRQAALGVRSAIGTWLAETRRPLARP